MGDQFEALRKALEAGPTPGPWVVKGRVHSSGEAVRVESHHPGYDHHLYQVCDVLDANGYPQNEANLLLICAADPDTIRALLAERDQLRTRVQELGAMARENRSRAVVELEAEMDKLQADARRYNAFFDAGLPITYLGQPYYTKADLDEAIDSARAGREDGNG